MPSDCLRMFRSLLYLLHHQLKKFPDIQYRISVCAAAPNTFARTPNRAERNSRLGTNFPPNLLKQLLFLLNLNLFDFLFLRARLVPMSLVLNDDCIVSSIGGT